MVYIKPIPPFAGMGRKGSVPFRVGNYSKPRVLKEKRSADRMAGIGSRKHKENPKSGTRLRNYSNN